MALRPVDAFDPALRQRALSAVVLAVGAVVAVVVGGWLFAAVILAAVVIMAVEFAGLIASGSPLVIAATAAIPCVAIVLLEFGAPLAAFVVVLAGAGLTALVLRARRFGAADWVAGGILYLGIPALSVVWLRNDVVDGLHRVMWLLLVVWTTDVCAYFVGRSLGGPKLAPRISPGKTWSGLLGGLAGAGLIGGAAASAVGAGFWLAALTGAVLAIVAQVGDLFESGLKRHAGVKDSGHLIPGHGGLLDRIDGLVFAAPVFASILWLTGRVGMP